MTSVARLREAVGIPWWLVLLEGIALIFLGVFLVLAPGATTILIVQFLGFYWLFSGILYIVLIFMPDRDMHWGWLLFKGILGIIAGLIVLEHPLWSAILLPTVLVILLGLNGLIMGILGLVAAFRGGGWGAGLLGAISIIFGLILLGSPYLAAMWLPWIFGIFALASGGASIVVAWRMRP